MLKISFPSLYPNQSIKISRVINIQDVLNAASQNTFANSSSSPENPTIFAKSV